MLGIVDDRLLLDHHHQVQLSSWHDLCVGEFSETMACVHVLHTEQ